MNTNNIFSCKTIRDESAFISAAQNRNVKRRTEAVSLESQESKMETQQEALPILQKWKNYVLEYKSYQERLLQIQQGSITYSPSLLLEPPPLPVDAVPILLSGGIQTSISKEIFLFLLNKCDLVESLLFSEIGRLTDHLNLSEFEEDHLRAALKIFNEGAITEESFELGNFGGIRLVEFLLPKKQIIFEVEPSFFINLPEDDVPENCQIQLQVSLKLEGAEVKSVKALTYFPNMQALSLKGCSCVRDFSPIAFLTSLRALSLSHTAFTDAGCLFDLKNLKKLLLSHCPIEDLTPLIKVEDGKTLYHLKKLEVLDLSFSKVYEISPLAHLPLKQLSIEGAKNIRDFKPLRHLRLERLNLAKTMVRDFSMMTSSIETLQALSANDCTQIRNFSAIATLKNLQNLNLSGTPFTDARYLSSLSLLKTLFLKQCPIEDLNPLVDIRDGQRSPYLKELNVMDLSFTNVQDISPLSSMPIKELFLENAKNIRDFEPLRHLQLEKLNLANTSFQDLTLLNSSANSLQELSLQECDILMDFSPISTFFSLKILNLFLTPFKDLSLLKNLSHLKRLSLAKCCVQDLSPLFQVEEDGKICSYLKELEALDLRETPVSDISPLSSMPLKELMLGEANQIQNFEVLRHLRLEKIDLAGTLIQDLSLLENSARSLKVLSLENWDGSSEKFSFLSRFTRLEELNASKTYIDKIRHLPKEKLKVLDLNGCEDVKDFEPVLFFTKLERLSVDIEKPLSLSFLLTHRGDDFSLSLPQLKHVVCSNQPFREASNVSKLRQLGVTVEEW